MAMLEAFLILWVMFVFLGATLGSWGIAQTAVLHSIAARNYSFFLFNNRSDLSYLRDFSYPSLDKTLTSKYYREDGSPGRGGKRFAFIIPENSSPDAGANVLATLRKVDFREDLYSSSEDGVLGPMKHNNIKGAVPERNQNKVIPAWIMVGYGICLSEKCGGD